MLQHPKAEWSTDSLVVQATEAGVFQERLRLEEIAAGVWEARPFPQRGPSADY